MNIFLNRFLKLIAVTALSVAMIGCGGGDSGGEIAPNNTASGSIKAGLLTVPEASLKTGGGSQISFPDDGGISLSSTDASLSAASLGQIIFVPASPEAGLPLPFTGRVTSVTKADGKTAIQLIPANIEDVFDSVSWDVNTSRDGSKIVGLISPKGANVSFRQVPSELQVGVTSTQLTNTLKYSGGKISGEFELTRDIKYKTEDGREQKFTLFVNTILSDISLEAKGEFNPKKYFSNDGWAQLKSVVSVDLKSAAVGFKAVDKTVMPSVSSALRSEDVWKSLKVHLSSDLSAVDENNAVYSLEGVKGDDKSGKIPLGGVVIAALPAGAFQPFTGNLGNEAVSMISKLPVAAILWLYVDLDGNLSFKGESGVRLHEQKFKQGFDFTPVGSDFNVRQINEKEVKASTKIDVYFKGEFEASQKIGLSAAGDVLLMGIRPATVNAFVGAQVKAKVEGDGGYEIFPSGQPFGYLCANADLWSGVDVNLQARIKAKFMVDSWVKVNYEGLTEWKHENRAYTWGKKEWPRECLVYDKFDFSTQLAAVDASKTSQRFIEVDFQETFLMQSYRSIATRWTLEFKSANFDQTVDVPADAGGKIKMSIPVGASYNITLAAYNKEKNLIKKLSKQLVMPPGPSFDFALSQPDAFDCKKVAVTPQFNSSQPVDKVEWKYRFGDNLFASAGSGLQSFVINIPDCGALEVQSTASDSLGLMTMATRSIKTGTFSTTPGYEEIKVTPANAVIGQSTIFTVTSLNGLGLPPSMVFELPDCLNVSALAGGTTSRQQFSCTPAGSVGARVIKLRSSANSDTYLPLSVNFSATATSASKVHHTGITPDQCYAAGSDALVSCTSAAAIALSGVGKQDGMYASHNAMSYSLVEGYSKEECVKDNVTGLLWEGKSASGERAGSKTYRRSGGDSPASYVGSVRIKGLCGYKDWRLPTVFELYGLMNASRPLPSKAFIDNNWFPYTEFNASDWYITSSYDVGGPEFWVVGFNFGFSIVNSEFNENTALVFVRLVRGPN